MKFKAMYALRSILVVPHAQHIRIGCKTALSTGDVEVLFFKHDTSNIEKTLPHTQIL